MMRLPLIISVFLVLTLKSFSYTWPPSQGRADTLAMKFEVIKSLPDSVLIANPTLFAEKYDVDEFELFVLKNFLKSILIWTKAEDDTYVGNMQVYLFDINGKKVYSGISQSMGILHIENMDFLTDGIYYIVANYGGKHEKNNTKPKSKVHLKITPYLTNE